MNPTSTVPRFKPIVLWNLTTLSIVKVADLLIDGYWSKEDWYVTADKNKVLNPLCLPKSIVKSLLRLLFVQLHPSLPTEKILRPLLMSGLDEIKLEFYVSHINVDNLKKIFRRLSQYGDTLLSINVRKYGSSEVELNEHDIEENTDIDNRDVDPKRVNDADISSLKILWSAFTNLLCSTPNLLKLRTNVLFDNTVLSKTPKLFDLYLPSPEFHCKLTKTLMGGKEMWKFLDILNNLPELINLNEGDLYCFVNSYIRNCNLIPLKKKYKLHSINTDIEINQRNCFKIQKMFPELKTLGVWFSPLSSLSLPEQKDFLKNHNIRVKASGDFEFIRNVIPGFDSLLLMFSDRIMELDMPFNGCSPKKFYSRCSSLPNLRKLCVRHICLCDHQWESEEDAQLLSKFRLVCKTLKEIHISCCPCNNKIEMYKRFLIFLLGSCLELQELVLKYRDLSDQIVFGVLNQNPFEKLKNAKLVCNSLVWQEKDLKVIKNIVANAIELESVKVVNYDMEEDEPSTPSSDFNMRHMIQGINPFIFVH